MSRQGRVLSDELAAHPGNFLIHTRGSYGVTKLLDKVGPENIPLIWPMWGVVRDVNLLRSSCSLAGESAPRTLMS